MMKLYSGGEAIDRGMPLTETCGRPLRSAANVLDPILLFFLPLQGGDVPLVGHIGFYFIAYHHFV